MVLVKLFGYTILIGSLLMKLPQIIKIKRNRSGFGISILAESIMLIALFGSMASGYTSKYPLSSYGESYCLFTQTFLVVIMSLYYEKKYSVIFAYFTVCLLIISLMLLNYLPVVLVNTLAGLTLILSFTSRLWQSWCIFRVKSTGNLSKVTFLMALFRSLTRIFTSIRETGDRLMIWTYILNSCVNLLLVFQFKYYHPVISRKD